MYTVLKLIWILNIISITNELREKQSQDKENIITSSVCSPLC